MTPTKSNSNTPAAQARKISAGTWTVLIILLSLLATTVVIASLGWSLASGADVPASGYVAMALGVIFSLAVGFGLMALVFYSSRKGYDEPPVLLRPETRDRN
jgi:hypothetical protein